MEINAHGQRRSERRRHDGLRIAADDGLDLVAVHLERRVEAHDQVVGEDAQRVLEGAAAGQRQLVAGRQLAAADEVARRVAVKVGVDDAVERLGELQIDVHAARRAAQRRRRPVGADHVRQLVQFRHHAVQHRFLRESPVSSSSTWKLPKLSTWKSFSQLRTLYELK